MKFRGMGRGSSDLAKSLIRQTGGAGIKLGYMAAPILLHDDILLNFKVTVVLGSYKNNY